MTLSKNERLGALVSNGYFPAELPPPFHTEDLARFRVSLAARWSQHATPKTVHLEPFSIPRTGTQRRQLSIVNPVPQLRLSQIIAENWISIRSHLNKSKYAIKRLEILKQERAIEIPDFNLVNLRRHDIMSRYDHVIFSDTSRFYSTIYTHAIPWALHTKKWCKDHLPRPRIALYNASLGAKLDTAIRLCQENQSIGIPIGPDTSRILSEIIASVVDCLFEEATRFPAVQAFRNVDDWMIGFDSSESSGTIISKLAAALRHFELEIHPEKTKVDATSNVPSNLWPSEVRKFAINEIKTPDKSNLVHFIEQCISLSHQFPQENVLNFSVKISSNFKISKGNWPLYESFLLRCCRTNTTTIPVVCKLLSEYHARQYDINRSKLQKLVADIIVRSAPYSYHFEVAWSLFLAKALNIVIPNDAARYLGEIESSVCALLALDCQASGLIPNGLNTSKWRKALTGDGLYSRMWLLAYEADKKNWLKGQSPRFVEQDKFFSELKQKNISFYDPNRTVRLVKTRKWSAKAASIENFLKMMHEDERFSADDDPSSLDAHLTGYGDFRF